MSSTVTNLDTLRRQLLAFRDERDWKQFHTLKNLIVSLNLESAELLELTQWKTDAQLDALKADAGFREALRDECADVLLYLLLVADDAGIDLLAAAQAKIAKNAAKYPVEQAFGSAKKYTELKDAARKKDRQ